MKKPTEPRQPRPPWPHQIYPQVREQIGPVTEDEDGEYIDEPFYPTVSIGVIKAWANANGIDDPDTVTVEMHPGSHVYELVMCGTRTITPKMKAAFDREHQAELKEFNEVTLPAYKAAKAKYDTDLRAYYKWKHDKV